MQTALIGPPPREIHFPGRGLTVADLNEIYDRLGSIGSNVVSLQRDLENERKDARRYREALMQKQSEHGRELAQLRRRIEISEEGIQRVGGDVERVKPLVDEVQRWRQRGIGFGSAILFLGMIAGGIGAKYVTPVLEALQRVVK